MQNQSANDTAVDAQTDWEVDPVAGDETGNSEEASQSPNSETSLSDATDTGQIDLDSLAEDSVSLSGALDSPEAVSLTCPKSDLGALEMSSRTQEHRAQQNSASIVEMG